MGQATGENGGRFTDGRVVIATLGTLGDLFPYLAIERELKRRGWRTIVATSRGHREAIETRGVAFHEVGPDYMDFGHISEWTQMATHPQRAPEYIIRRMVLPFLRESYGDLESVVAGAACVVAHSLNYAAKLAAERHGVPLVVVALQPSTFLSTYDPPVIPRAPTGMMFRRLGRPFFSLLFRLVRWVLRGWAGPIHHFRDEIGLPHRRLDPLVEGQFSERLNLALFSPLLAEPDPDWPAHTVQTGFAFYADDGRSVTDDTNGGGGKTDRRRLAHRLTADLERFLASGPPPVVFTLGSLAVLNPGSFFAESVAAARRLGRRAVLLTANGDPQGPDADGKIFTAGFVPHSKLFPHAAVIVHQGGVGTTAEALRAGRPELVVPFSNDQPDNARRAARLGVARVLSAKRYRARRVAAELNILLQDGAYAARAAQLAESVGRERGAEMACDAIEECIARSNGG